MAEFLNLTKGFMGGIVHARYPELDMDRAVDRVVTTYVTGPGVTDPEQLLDAYVQVDVMMAGPLCWVFCLWFVVRDDAWCKHVCSPSLPPMLLLGFESRLGLV